MNPLEVRRRLLGRNVYKRTTEGNPAIAQGSLARMYPGITMQGWTEQAQYEGKNLFDGAQFGQSGKVLHVESTSGNRDITGIDYKQNTAYTISIESHEIITPSESGDWSVNFTIYYTDGSKDQKYTKYLGGNPLTSNKNKTIRRMTIENPWNVEEKITGIMITEGDKALPYEPYTGRQPSPNPDYPQEIVSAGKYDEASRKYQYTIKISDSEESPTKSQTVTLTSDRPLTKWDRLEKRNGQWGWVYKSEEIESYTDESVPGEYFSTTGQLSTGAQVWYETTTETFVPLTASEQEAMNALYTFRPTTVLSNDCGCNMTLAYKTKKSLEVAT